MVHVIYMYPMYSSFDVVCINRLHNKIKDLMFIEILTNPCNFEANDV